jgi:signal transduction histidine kinase
MSSAWFLGMSGLAAAAALLIVSSLVLAICLVRLQDHFTKAQESENVLSVALDLQQDLNDAVAAARGYLATKDDTLFQLRENAKQHIHRHLVTLATVVKDDPVGERAVQGLTTSILRRVQAFDSAIALARTSAPPAQILASETERTRLVRLGNLQVAGFCNYERGVIADEQRLVQFDVRMSVVLVLLTGVIAPLFGLFGIHLLRRERMSQQAHELQTELMHAQRLGIMGEAAAMLAHEVKQPLTAATNFLAALRRTLQNAPDKAPALIDRIAQQIQRADTIVRKLRSFIEKREAERSPETPEILFDDAITLLGTIDGSIALKTVLADDLPAILVDRVQLQQVLVNLMRNAIEAMHDSPSRELTLSASALEKNRVEISLADTGPGLPADVAEHLFQPFVSTKPNGMGVGLSICQTIIAQHGGRIWAEPNPGGGTVFRFTLPIVEERAAA